MIFGVSNLDQAPYNFAQHPAFLVVDFASGKISIGQE
jgi:hypothetical protein